MKGEWKDWLLVLSLTAVVILSVFLVLCEKKALNKSVDNFCNCFGPGTNTIGDAKTPSFKGQVCYDKQKIVQLYNAGKFQNTFAGV